MEFNENLHRQLISKEKLVKKLQEELTELRGPVSEVLYTFIRLLPHQNDLWLKYHG